ncbi:MAG TPA: NAD-dependent epimerase/dehydratase family protein, partial [Capillimicrobium sp.]
RLDNVRDLGARHVSADLRDRAAVRRAMKGVTRVFHVAGRTSLRGDPERLWRENVETTRVVLEEALRAGVERVVYTSSAAAVGPAKPGFTADEEQRFPVEAASIPYVRTKRDAEIEALRIAGHGLPVVIVNPAHVFGRGDVNRSSTELVRRFLRRDIPAYVDGALNVVDAEDVARGHLLADERGTPGERYLLGNRNFTLDRLFADLGRLSGVAPPAVKLPTTAAMALARAAEALPGRPALTVTEVLAQSMWWTFRSNKARRELGWRPSHHEDTLQATIDWYREREPDRLSPAGSRQPIALRVGGGALRHASGALGRIVP